MAAPVYRHERIGSTLDLLHQLAEEGAPSGTAVVAREQTAGRGSRGKTWHSPRGGLWLAWLCRPATPLAAEVLSLRVGLAVARVLEQMGSLPAVGVKWPNDVLVGGRKVAGILCEARWQAGELGWIAVGVGLNVSNPVPPDVAATATRLGDYCGDVTPDSVLAVLLGELAGVEGMGATLTADELAAFDTRDWIRGRLLAEPLAGIARGIAPDGGLRVEQRDGTIDSIRSGHVVLAGTAAPPITP